MSSQEVADAYAGTFNTSGQVLYIPSSLSVTSLKASSENKVNLTNQAKAPENITSLTSIAVKNAHKTQTSVNSGAILDGSKSNDRDGKIELYQWQQIRGPKVALDDANNIKTSFISPPVDHDTMLVFKLTIADDNGGSNSAITAVKVIKNQELPSITRNITDTSSSEPEDKSIKTEDVTNSTRR